MKLFEIQKNVMSGQCRNTLLRIQVRYTALFIGIGLIPNWIGSQIGLFTPKKFKDGYKCLGFYFRPWLAPDVPVIHLPKWYRNLMKFISFRID